MKKSFLFFFFEAVRTPNPDGLAALICLLYNGKDSLRETKLIFVSRFRGIQKCAELLFFFCCTALLWHFVDGPNNFFAVCSTVHAENRTRVISSR